MLSGLLGSAAADVDADDADIIVIRMKEWVDEATGKKSNRDWADNAFSESQVVNIKQQFISLDKDGDGLISENEFIQALKNANRKPEEYDTQKFFTSADKNKDGKITFSEFLNACQKLGLAETLPVAGQPSKKSSHEADAIFRNFDRDGDGTITAQELSETLQSQGEKPTDSDIQDMLNAADKNNDKKIDREEFKTVV
ncbi:hypothetical protein BGX27_002785 [Mortierella sp. AM989]|nr:hypothetical protein BGX27_002755 [Mortierella sp. AM989]KAF9116425.1 hypothetical protein BGX27_002785 [Mortierella sp. AM989]